MYKSDKERMDFYLKEKTIKNGDCLNWTGSCDSRDGYPRINYNGNSNTRLHRIMFKAFNPDISIEHFLVRHKCDNEKCINPDHLEIGTAWDNMHDRDKRLRSATAKISPEDALKMRELSSEKTLKLSEIGKIFNLSYRSVLSIVKRKTWKWV